MKKTRLLSALTAMTLVGSAVSSMLTTVYAHEGDETPHDEYLHGLSQTATMPVYINLKGSEETIVYCVGIEWDADAFNFEYDLGEARTWDPATHTYSGAEVTLSGEANITVYNHSNAAVNVSFAYDLESGSPTTSGSFNGVATTTIDLATAVKTAYADAPKEEVTFAISGTPDVSSYALGDKIQVGKITVTLAS